MSDVVYLLVNQNGPFYFDKMFYSGRSVVPLHF